MGSDLEVNIKVELSGQDIKEWTSGPRVLEKKHVDKKKGEKKYVNWTYHWLNTHTGNVH